MKFCAMVRGSFWPMPSRPRFPIFSTGVPLTEEGQQGLVAEWARANGSHVTGIGPVKLVREQVALSKRQASSASSPISRCAL